MVVGSFYAGLRRSEFSILWMMFSGLKKSAQKQFLGQAVVSPDGKNGLNMHYERRSWSWKVA